MPTKRKPDQRNRSALAREQGRFLRAFELSAEADAGINQAADHLRATGIGRATRVQALEWLIRQGLMTIPKKPARRT